jgi:tetratricopeptide (TPR) repeat protein
VGRLSLIIRSGIRHCSALQGDAEKALQDAEDCIRVNPGWAKGFSRKGAALHALRRYEEAVSSYEEGSSVAC